MKQINYRTLNSSAELHTIEALQRDVWGMTDLHVVGASTIRWMIHIGGLALGAYDGDQIVGFSIASPGKRENQLVLWSDMTGVHPDYQGQGIGLELKLRQRSWAREQGFKEIRWTFDPMQRGNAHFNFRKLGITSHTYLPDFYGGMRDNINVGLQTDRLEAIWNTTGDKAEFLDPPYAPEHFILWFDGNTLHRQKCDNEVVFVQIPYRLNHLRQQNMKLAIHWQAQIREIFLGNFNENFQAFDFIQLAEKCFYVLKKSKS